MTERRYCTLHGLQRNYITQAHYNALLAMKQSEATAQAATRRFVKQAAARQHTPGSKPAWLTRAGGGKR